MVYRRIARPSPEDRNRRRFLPVLAAAVVAMAMLSLLLGRGHTNAAPPDQQINITVTDGKVPGLMLGGTCWQIFYRVTTPPQQNVPYDIVGDNTKVCAGAQHLLVDKDPAVGSIRITISGALRAQFGDEWHALQTQAPLKYGLDFTKRMCDLSLGKCELSVQNFLKLADILINVTDSVTSSLLAGQCAEIRTPDQATLIKKICDGDPGDKDPGPGIDTNVAFGSYSVDYQMSRLPANREVKQPKRSCTVANSPTTQRQCKAAFLLNGVAKININVTDNETSSLVAGQCAEIRTPDQVTLIQKICDGNPNDTDPGAGIQVTEPFGSYSVEYQTSSAPPNRIPKQPTKRSCSISDTQKTCKAAFALNAPTPTPTLTRTATPTPTATQTATPTPRITPLSVGGISLDPGLSGPAPVPGGSSGGMIAIAAAVSMLAIALGGPAWYLRRRLALASRRRTNSQ